MKRTPLKRRSAPLRPDPDKVREWMRKPRAPMKRGKRKQRQPTPPAVLALIDRYSGGHCVICGAACDARRDRHHLLPVQRWPEYELTAENQVLLDITCHMNHENAARRLTLEEMPGRCRRWLIDVALEDGEAYAYVRRTYPPTRADQPGGTSDGR